MARLTAPDGTVVSVGDDKVDGLVARGYTETEEKAKAKKSPSSSKPNK